MHTHVHKCISFAAGKSSDRYFPGKAACPRCAVCLSRFGQGTTNKCRALFPSSRGKIHRPLPRVSPRAAAAPRGSNARVPVGCGIIMKCRGTRSANDHPVALFLWTVFSISLFSWIRSFYPTFRSGKQQVSLQRDTAEFSNPENLGLFFIFLFSCSRMSENKLTQLIHWIYTLSQCKLTSPSSAFFFPVITQSSRAVSQDGAVLWSLVLMWNTTSKSNAFFFLSCDLVRYQSFLWL